MTTSDFISNQEGHLDRDMQVYRQSVFAESTKATYRSHLRSFLRFCLYFGYEPLPCSTLTICRYVVFLARTLSYTSIPNYINIIRLIHMEAGLDNPLDSYRIKSLLKGVQRNIGKPPKQKLPITIEILKQMERVLDLSSTFNQAFWAAALIAFFTFLRKASLLPKSATTFNPNFHLTRESASFVDNGIILCVRNTKTIQYRERELQIPIPCVKNSRLCPVQALKKLLGNQKIDRSPLFSFVENGQSKILTHSTFVVALKKILCSCGYNAEDFSGHSFRRGGATHAFKSKIPDALIKMQGDWKSNAYLRYIDVPMEVRWEMMEIFSQSV